MTILQQLFDPSVAQQAIETISSNNTDVESHTPQTAMLSLIILLSYSLPTLLLSLSISYWISRNRKKRTIIIKSE